MNDLITPRRRAIVRSAELQFRGAVRSAELQFRGSAQCTEVPYYELAHEPSPRRWPRWWRLTIVAISTLILCSCQAGALRPFDELGRREKPTDPFAAAENASPSEVQQPTAHVQPAPGSVVQASTVAAQRFPAIPVEPLHCQAPLPVNHGPPPGSPPWAPPGIARPWPQDEYIFDGGDRNIPVLVQPDWRIKGLEPEDAIVHYDTLDGRTVVEATNRVCLYAPRFSSVRSVTSLIEDRSLEVTRGVVQPEGPIRYDLTQIPATSLQQEKPTPQIGVAAANAYRLRLTDGALSMALLPGEFVEAFLPYENLAIIRRGMYEQADKPRLAQGIEAAIVWTDNKAVQVVLDLQRATEVVGDARAEAVFSVSPPGPPKLRICKVGSACSALPGETVDFTIRYDNVGEQTIGNVTIVDSLSPRLELVPGSNQSSLKANFVAEPNEAGSLNLRFEILDPLKPGDGGIVRFRCRVR